MDYSKFVDLRTYVLEDVKREFEEKGFLNAFGFHCDHSSF